MLKFMLVIPVMGLVNYKCYIKNEIEKFRLPFLNLIKSLRKNKYQKNLT